MAYDGSGSNSMDSLSAEQLQAIGLTRRERGAFHWDAMDPAKFEDPQDADCYSDRHIGFLLIAMLAICLFQFPAMFFLCTRPDSPIGVFTTI